MGKAVGNYQYRECGLDNIWIDSLEMYKCPDCQMKMPVLPNPEQANKAIAALLIRESGRLDSDSILFLRKAMQLTGAELAVTLGVHRVEVSRWENDRVNIDSMNDFKLRMTAIDKLLPVEKQRSLRSELAVMFQKTYDNAVMVRDREISVPAVPIECVIAQQQSAFAAHQLA